MSVIYGALTGWSRHYGNTQSYLWDANVAGMSEDGQERYYLQDEMGSPIRLMDEDGDLKDSYGYDEFGQDLYGNQGILQPFGYTRYQADRITGTYYAQAREYRAELGRFAAVDTIKGFTAAQRMQLRKRQLFDLLHAK